MERLDAPRFFTDVGRRRIVSRRTRLHAYSLPPSRRFADVKLSKSGNTRGADGAGTASPNYERTGV